MEPFQRFSILTLPQEFNGTTLSFNIVVLPRDQNPLAPAIVASPPMPNSDTAFADAQFVFTAKVLSGFDINPLPKPSAAGGIPLGVETPENARAIFEALAQHMQIEDVGMTNSNYALDNIPPDRKPESPRTRENSVKKHIPKSFFNASGIKVISNENAVTDDSYHCALKAGKFDPDFKQSTDSVSWGQVFAYLLKQPLLAREAGMIFSASIPIEAETFPDGGYLYVDITGDSSYFDQQSTNDTFIRRYAAHIPALAPGDEPRPVFAPVLFPVVPVHQGNYDKLFIEAAEYDDGFAKIVHTFQPRNRDLIVEDSDGNYPTKDVGIQFGFDDVQILERYMRMLMEDLTVGAGKRLDAPVGVYGFNVDVRETATPENNWESLNRVTSKQPLVLSRQPGNNDDPIPIGDFNGELPFQVYPVQINARKDLNFWLPMYYGTWNGHSIVLPDEDAAAIYQNTNNLLKADEEMPVLDDAGNPVLDAGGKPVTTGTGVKAGGAANQLNQIYNPVALQTVLRYGHNYEFRVRMQDISGGSPSIESGSLAKTPSDTATTRFKRYLSPNQPRVQELQPTGNDDDPIANKDNVGEISELNIKRPKLGYPAVVFTDKYQPGEAVNRLIAQSQLGIDVDETDHNVNAEHRVGLGIADPDVDRVEVVVEIASLKMDKLASISGKEDYVYLYTTDRHFPAINNDDDFEATLNIPIEYVDVAVLHTGDEADIATDLNLPGDIDDLPQLILPTGRTVRLTLRAVCEEKADSQNYFGVIDEGDKQMDNRFGEVIQMVTYSPSEVETDLFENTAGVPALQGIFMQPDVKTTFDGKYTSFLLGKEAEFQPDTIQLLAGQLKLNHNKLTLSAPKGERIVFGCSSRIRHTLAPDNSSITFASKGDLVNHWLCCISLEINRDWMWDEMETTSFLLKRTIKYTNTAEPEATDAQVGDIEMIRTAPFDALKNPNRNASRILFIDAVEPSREVVADKQDFPDTIEVSYRVEARFKNEDHEAVRELEMVLPITTFPKQVPKIVSAGYALSPYQRNETYSSSDIRQRFLWIEFSEPIEDKNDAYFARVLHVAPDQLISNNNLGLLQAEQDPPLPIDPEFMRVVIPESSNDLAGLTAMQPMEKSTSDDVHYLLPIPEGLHPNADEFFGFFTYEFRVGHYRNPKNNEMVWTTAQGRFGRRLKVTGIQHPAPTLTCMTNRDEDKMWVTAPYAVAVSKGKNVTADPPRTELWALLYAQVKQADNLDYRNILLDDKYMDSRVQIVPAKDVAVFQKYNAQEINLLNTITYSQFNNNLNYAGQKQVLQLADYSNKNEDATKYGTTAWTNKEIGRLLAMMALPSDAALSVIVVEILPQITRISEHITKIKSPAVAQEAANLVPGNDHVAYHSFLKNTADGSQDIRHRVSPVDEDLGNKRIYRTSNLTPVPEVCCTDCS